MLKVDAIETFYGASQVLFGMSLEIAEGEVISLMGRNGMGKTTTVRSIIGMTPPRTGRIEFDGTVLGGVPVYRIAQMGIGLVPEGRRIFATLSVEENLVATAADRIKAGAAAARRKWNLEGIYRLFPALADRKRNMGTQLSGGEQQMLAIGRALMTNPKLLILDEATEGLAPLIRQEIWRIIRELKAAGQSILIIDKNVKALAEFADRHYVVEKGKVAWQGNSAELHSNLHRVMQHVGVGES
ncbi:MAG: ABC transporter ATP-binding protein [Alphaproteobacteria bacterium]